MSTSSYNHSEHFRWIDKSDAVCPVCCATGHLEYQESSWDHRCNRTRTRWTWSEYRNAVRALLADAYGVAA